MLPPVILPVALKDVSVPTEVILVWAAVVSVPIILVPDKLPLVMLPVTANDVNVPTEVILVCAAVIKVPEILVPDKLPPVMLPVTLRLAPVITLPAPFGDSVRSTLALSRLFVAMIADALLADCMVI